MSSIILPPFSVNAACALPEKIRPGQQIKPAENKDFFENAALHKPACRVHCHRATIFEVAGAIWNKFFKE
ncbi:MAG TPA: hypothetical protein VJA17_02025 [Candidatus Omnitrophota bacterium]|nr:hypothetical protein [Candidatus Omnitrophota bacterium]